jgi:hypothetical protein
MLQEDLHYLRKLLRDGEAPIVRALVLRYADTWRQASMAEPLPHRRDNRGRYAANCWIRQETEALRHAEPEIVQRYRKILHTGMPRCCHTCYHYTDDGKCTLHGEHPPEDFAGTVPTVCTAWEEEIPF